MKRRQFLTGVTGAAVTTALSASRIIGANERVRVGLIGCGNRGLAVARLMREVPAVEFPAVCDVYDTNAQAGRQWAGSDAVAFKDFRKLLERPDIDAVLIATPDHWHAIPTVLGCQAGKDVYVEKPLAHNIKEGRAMVSAARRHNRIVQTGVQHRSAPHYREVQRIIQSGELGDVGFVRVWNFNSLFPQGIGREPDSPVPAGLDWDFYLGPAPLVPFNKARFLSSFRYFWDYAGGWITDFGTHRLDTVQQVMGVESPLTAVATGGRFAVKDTGDMPDVLQVTYEYPRFVLSYETCTMSGVGSGGRTPGMAYYRARGEFDRPHGEAFYGTNGALFCDRIGYEIYPELKPGQRAGAPPSYRMERKSGSGADATNLHVKNFIECVRSRNKPVGDIEIGHRSTIVPHLGNISYRTGKKLYWDAAKEDFKNEPDASRLLGRKARKPWDLI